MRQSALSLGLAGGSASGAQGGHAAGSRISTAVLFRLVVAPLVALIAYLAAARLGLLLAYPHTIVSPVWPASGVAIGVLWVWGRGTLPALAAGSLLAGLLAGVRLPVALELCGANLLEWVLAVHLMRRAGLSARLDRVRDVLILTALGGGLSTMASAVPGVLTIQLAGLASGRQLIDLAGYWWIGHGMGVLVVTPLLLLATRARFQAIALRRGFEAVVIAAVLGIGTGSVFLVGQVGLPFLIFPLAIWVALRFDQWGAALATAAVSGTAVWGTVHGSGPFATGSLEHQLANLQLYVASFGLTAMVLAAAVASRRQADRMAADRAAQLEASNRIAAAQAVQAQVNRSLAARLAAAQDLAGLGSWEWDLRSGELTWSENLQRLYGASGDGPEPSYQTFLERVHPDDRGRVNAILTGSSATGEAFDFTHRLLRPDGGERYLHCRGTVERDAAGGPLRMNGAALDITEATLAAEHLRERARELERSNQDLEQFAYVASHDLQEPLRMVASYVQLIQKRYQGRLDEDADEYIGFAVDGATRMQELIIDLLAYSRVGRGHRELSVVEVAACVATASANLATLITASGARIVCPPLPSVLAEPTELVQLFQNLISNAVKFRGAEPPVVAIGVEAVDGLWRFSVSDNGIGMDPSQGERVFMVFQRLHSRDTFPGTGIGLAICKKVVEHHGGRIWLESQAGAGTTFHFTLPMAVAGVSDRPWTSPPELALPAG